MPQFILALPMDCAADESIAINENLSIAPDAKTAIIPGCSVTFNVIRKPHVDGLADIFKEHQDVPAEELAKISAHKSLLFLLGEVKNVDEVNQVNMAILKLFNAGAKGVYMQQSGAAWSDPGFRDEVGDGEYPMDPWINFVENAGLIYTLGMACFALPDLSISATEENAQEALLLAADALFGDGIPAKSGSEIELEDETFVLRQETKILFPKDSPEYNRQGVLRVNRKK